MKFAFEVKHNGVNYKPGQVVPIGQEPKKELQTEDKSASELSKELKDRFNIDMAPQKGKAKLLEALAEAEKNANEEEENPEEEVEDLEPAEGNEPELTDEENEEESFLDSIINE